MIEVMENQAEALPALEAQRAAEDSGTLQASYRLKTGWIHRWTEATDPTTGIAPEAVYLLGLIAGQGTIERRRFDLLMPIAWTDGVDEWLCDLVQRQLAEKC